MHRLYRNARQVVLGLLFPPVCMNCNQELAEETCENGLALPFCTDCLFEMPIYAAPFCIRCGCGSILQNVDGCRACARSQFRFDQSIALGKYETSLRQLLLEMKHEIGEAKSLAVGQLLWSRCRERLLEVDADVVVPIPMHWSRRWARGTNSPQLLAGVLSRHLGRPVAHHLLRRRRKTLPQSSLAPSERERNLRNAMAVRAGYSLAGTKVLVVDDIMTTGATANAAARALKSAGASQVILCVAARSTSD
jgi:ComF family protein